MIFRDIRLIGSNLSSRAQLEDLVRFVVDEDVVVDLVVYHGLGSLYQLYNNAKSGGVAGKMVVVIDEDKKEFE